MVGCEYRGRMRVEPTVLLFSCLPVLLDSFTCLISGMGVSNPTSGEELTVVLRAVDLTRRRIDLGLPG